MKNNHNLSETELVSLLKKDNQEAFEQLYHRYKFRLAGNLVRLVKSEDLAEELLQMLFVKLWETRHKIDPEKSFRSYLFRIAENLVYDMFRKAARDSKLQKQFMEAASVGYSHVEETLYYEESREKLEEVLKKMPPQCRKVFTICKLEGKSYQEASDLLGLSVHTVSNHMTKAMRMVKEHFYSVGAVSIITAVLFQQI